MVSSDFRPDFTMTTVLDDGQARTITASGFGAETLIDRHFNEMTKDPRVVFSFVALGGGGCRHTYVPTALKRGG